jgi:hypothetical protein
MKVLGTSRFAKFQLTLCTNRILYKRLSNIITGTLQQTQTEHAYRLTQSFSCATVCHCIRANPLTHLCYTPEPVAIPSRQFMCTRDVVQVVVEVKCDEGM